MGYRKDKLDFKYRDSDVNVTDRQDKYAYMFDSISDVEKFSNDVFQSVPNNSRAYRIMSAYATEEKRLETFDILRRSLITKKKLIDKFGTDDPSFIREKLNRFIFADRVEVEVSKLVERINKQKFVDIDQVKRIEFTEKEAGIFSFDLASLGLIRVYEYYSPVLKSNVSPNMVVSEKTSSGELLFYYVGNPFVEKHYIEYDTKRGGYYSPILGRMVNKNELIEEEGQNKVVTLYYEERQAIPRHEVERVQAVDKDGKKKFATTFKKCFIEIKRVQNRLPRVDIIVPMSYASAVTAEQAFWNCIQILAICEKLSKSNVIYRVIAGISDFLTISGDKRVYKFVKLKDENQPLDANSLAILVSDMRYYRMSNFFFKQAAQYDSGFGDSLIPEIAYPITNSEETKAAYINFLSKQTSESDKEAAKLPDSKIVLNYALSEAEALQGYNNTITQIANL